MSDGTVLWITGLPGAGKSTLAARIAERARAAFLECVVLDGDEVRDALGRRAGQGDAERDDFYASLARLAALLARQGLVVVVPATANRLAHRVRARSLAPRYVEVHVATPAAECARRDPKRLYASARAGLAAGVPGCDAAYEAPPAPDVTASGGEDARAVDRVMDLLTACGGAIDDRASERRNPAGGPAAPPWPASPTAQGREGSADNPKPRRRAP